METRSGAIVFERGRGNGPRTAQQTFNFNQPVNQAVAILSGTNFGFSPSDDHHLGKVTARLDTAIDDDVVTVTGTFGVRDWSGNWDDNYEGSLQFLLLADLEVGAAPSNLLITGTEFNQATQFFARSCTWIRELPAQIIPFLSLPARIRWCGCMWIPNTIPPDRQSPVFRAF